MDDTRILEGDSFEFVKNFGHLIGVKGGDSGGKSVSRCDPAESERIVHNSFATSNRRSIFFKREEAHGPPAESVRQ
jgi:hypothetical protein